MSAATRVLYIKTAAGPITVPVEIGVPCYDRDAWTCNFSIGWPEGPQAAHATGYDGVQALLFAMEHVAIFLYMSAPHKAGTLYFDEPGAGYGFPLPFGGRSEAIGGDAKL